MRLPRLTTRRLMALVAVAALAMGGAVGLWRRRESFRRAAQAHAEAAQRSADALWAPRLADDDRASAVPLWQQLAHHNRLREKYDRAARYPWLPVPADPTNSP